MAEHPGTMAESDFDVSGFCVGVVDRPKMIGPDLVREGDVVLGLASSGLHSNGYSLVRRSLTDRLSDEELSTQELPSGAKLGEALLAPTQLYVKPLLSALSEGLPIHAAAHITGGGITENLNRALPKGLDAEITLATWVVPEVIDRVLEAAGLDVDNALKTFNMGIGMAIICAAEDVAEITKHFMKSGKVYRLGEIIASADASAAPQVRYRTKG